MKDFMTAIIYGLCIVYSILIALTAISLMAYVADCSCHWSDMVKVLCYMICPAVVTIFSVVAYKVGRIAIKKR